MESLASHNTNSPYGKLFSGLTNTTTTLLIALLVLMPLILPSYHSFLLTEILIWGLFAMGFNILWGYTGLLSFGQGLYFGTGAYMVAFSTLYLGLNLFNTMLAAVIGSILMAWGTGFFAIRLTGHYFVILTCIFSQVFFFLSLAFRDFTGGDDGLTRPPRSGSSPGRPPARRRRAPASSPAPGRRRGRAP